MPGQHIKLARLFDKEGREREALVEYRTVVYGSKNTWSSNQEDPRVLTRYGDLCEAYDMPREAARDYAYAAQQMKHAKDSIEPDPLPRDDSYLALKAAAHTAAGLELGSHGDFQGRTRELNFAVSIDPSYWVPYYYRARDLKDEGREKEAVREAGLAERLAPSEGRKLVTEMRRRSRIPDAQGYLLDMAPLFAHPSSGGQ